MWKLVALVFVCGALVSVPIALAQTQGKNPTTAAKAEAAPSQIAVPAPPPCTPLKEIYTWKNWRDAHPLRGENPCLPNPNRGKLRAYFGLYRHYRSLTPYRCTGGREGWYAIPCGIIACESHFNWGAANPSGAVGVYQLLGWGAPYPARTFAQRVRNHEIAAGLSLSNWVCAG